MSRTPTRRTRFWRALLLLIFAVGSPSLGGAYRCCTNGAQSPSDAVADAAASAPAADVHAHHQHHGDADDSAASNPDTDSPAPWGAQLPQCECVGQCHESPSQRPAPISVAERHPVPVAVHEVPSGTSRTIPAKQGEYRQPFANGPPTTRLG